MFNVILYQPEIPPNTGNIIRLCANSNCRLHLVKPLGFDFSDKKLRRAGLDYHEFANVMLHDSWGDCITVLGDSTLFGCTTKGSVAYDQVQFTPGDSIVMGPETRGLPAEILQQLPDSQKIRIPMQPQSRSLNLSNATAIILYEALRQNSFASLR